LEIQITVSRRRSPIHGEPRQKEGQRSGGEGLAIEVAGKKTWGERDKN